MTERANQLDRLLKAITCRHCLGNGRLGGREHAPWSGTGAATASVDRGRTCETCKGSGVQSPESAHV